MPLTAGNFAVVVYTISSYCNMNEHQQIAFIELQTGYWTTPSVFLHTSCLIFADVSNSLLFIFQWKASTTENISHARNFDQHKHRWSF